MIEKTKKYFLALVVFALAASVRLTEALSWRDYWYDEAFTGILLKSPWNEMNRMIFADVHPPLYYWLVKIFAAPFDYSPFGIRFMSLLFGLGIVASLIWIGTRMFNFRVGIVAGFIAAISPFAIEYSQEARMYSLFGFLMLWATWFFIRALKTDRFRYWVLWGIFGGLAFYTHYLSLFFFILFYFSSVFYLRVFSGFGWVRAPFVRKGFWAGVAVIFFFFLSWIKYFIPHVMKGNLGWIPPTYFSEIPKTLQIFFFGHPAGTGGTPVANEFEFLLDGSSAGLLLLVFFVAASIFAWKKQRHQEETFLLSFISIGTLVFLILISHLNVKLYVARYFMPAAVLIYLLTAGLLVSITEKTRYIFGFLLLYIVMIFMLKPLSYDSGWSIIAASDFGKNASPERPIITDNPFEYTSARYYFGEDKIYYYNKNNPTEDFSGWVVVGNERRLTTKDELESKKEALFISGDCNWAGIELFEVYQAGKYKICKMAP